MLGIGDIAPVGYTPLFGECDRSTCSGDRLLKVGSINQRVTQVEERREKTLVFGIQKRFPHADSAARKIESFCLSSAPVEEQRADKNVCRIGELQCASFVPKPSETLEIRAGYRFSSFVPARFE